MGPVESRSEESEEEVARLALDVARRLLASKGVRGADLDDLCQEAAASAIRFLRQSCAVVGNLSAFLEWRARGALSHHRRRRLESALGDPDVVVGRAGKPTDPDLREALRACREQLGPYARVITAAFDRGLTVSQIEAELDMPEGTVCSHRYRGVRKLRDCLRRKGFERWPLT